MKYTCAKCGEEHEGLPSVGFEAPHHYNVLNDEDKKRKATLSGDLCTITHEEQVDRFIRGVMHFKLNDDCGTLDYGVWVSLSEKSFEDYKANLNNDKHEGGYFGYLCNNIAGYEDNPLIKTNVILQGSNRPDIVPHDDQMEIDLVKDYYEGIDRATAEERIKFLLS